ncbi:PHP domain-containing protein [Candidatus Saccharibacteria bacterium]|nr:PHP domain-containing protein [Candidatus Saccharibacteria bacterium]
MFRVDLHTHSVASPDGGISMRQYRKAFETGLLDCIAITDHNRIDFATQAKAELGERIIIGEEIMTTLGEIVGLYLSEVVQPGQTPGETIAAIKAQDGIVYIPHPFETIRKGLHPATLDAIANDVDIVEVCNGRALAQNRSQQALVWSKLNAISAAASSDAHGLHGLGRTYTSLAEIPTQDNLVKLVNQGVMNTSRAVLRSLLYPKYHTMRKKLSKRT